MKLSRLSLLVLFSLLICICFSGCSKPDPNADSDKALNAIDVQIDYPQYMDLSRETEFVGHVESGTSINIFSEVPAKIIATYKNVGEYVSEGELLMEVDSVDMQNALLSAQSGLAAANLSYQQTKATQTISTEGSAYQTKQLTNSKTLDDLLDKYYETLRSGSQLNDSLDSYTVALWDATSAKNKAQSAYATVSAETLAKAAAWYSADPEFSASGISSDGFAAFVTGEASPQIDATVSTILQNKLALSTEVYNQQLSYSAAYSALATSASAEKQAQTALKTYEKQYDTQASTIDSSIRSITKNYDYYAKTYGISDTLGASETQMLNGITLATLKLSCDNAQRNVDTAQKNLEKCKIFAPVSGTITTKNATVSNFASSAAPMYVIAADHTAPVITFSVSEDAIDALVIGSPITVIAGDKSINATISELANATSAGSGLYAAKASLPLDCGIERTGMVVKVRTATAEAKHVLCLPLNYIEYDENQPYVLVYRDGTAVRCDLELGMSTRTDVEILSGIVKDDAIITTWHPELHNGSPVSCEALTATDSSTSTDDTIEVIE